MNRVFTRQRLVGLALTAIGVLALWLCMTSGDLRDRDGTGPVAVIALGLWLVLSRRDLLR